MTDPERRPRRSAAAGPTDDPLAHAFPVRRNLPAFLFSTAFHGLLFVLLATFSVAVVRREERINVRVIEPSSVAEETETEGLPSLTDVAGILTPQSFRPKNAGSVAGPSVTAGPPVSQVRSTEMPRIAGVAPSIGANPGSLDIPLGIGGGFEGGVGGGGFGAVVQGLRKVGIDLVIVIDTSGSMQSVLDEVKAQVEDFIGNLQQLVPASRVAVVAYRDKGEEYVTKWVDFSFKTAKVQQFVAGLRADGGGDYEEGVKQGIEAAIDELTWRKSARRIIILVGGTPPHKEDMQDLMTLVREFRKDNGAVGAVDVTKRLHEEYDREAWVAQGSKGTFQVTPMPGFYKETTDVYGQITQQGGGELLTLGQEKALLQQVMALTFGTRWRTEMARAVKQQR